MKTYQVRRASASLGLFNERELRALVQKGKLLPTDELDQGSGQWGSLGTFMASLPPVAVSASPRPAASAPAAVGRHFYLHAQGSRVGPLELSKLEGMAQAGLIDATAMLEDVAVPGQLVPVGNHVALPSPDPVPSPSVQPVFNHTPPSTTPSPAVAPVAPSQVAPSSTGKPKASFLDLWLKATLWIYGLGALFGYLAGNLDGFLAALVVGLLVAPLKGAFWGWIIWLFKK